jgi:hypothetical protein
MDVNDIIKAERAEGDDTYSTAYRAQIIMAFNELKGMTLSQLIARQKSYREEYRRMLPTHYLIARLMVVYSLLEEKSHVG